MKLLLIRDRDDGICTLGTLQIFKVQRAMIKSPVWQTLERPWVPNPSGAVGGEPGRSCVPPGVYELVLHDSELHPRTWALVNPKLGVTHYGPSNRSAVLIHPANYPYELRGCIAPGMVRFAGSVGQSRMAFEQIRDALPWINGHTIEIRGPK